MNELNEWLGTITKTGDTTRWNTVVTCGGLLRVHVYGDPDLCSMWRIEDAIRFASEKLLCRWVTRRTVVHAYVLNIYDTPKCFPRTESVLRRRHINSGMCIRSQTPRMYVYRTQEVRKVFFHELIHACNAYQSDSYFPIDLTTFPKWKSYLRRHQWLSGFQTALKLTEAVTEALACSLEIMYLADAFGLDLEHLRVRDRLHSAKVAKMFLDWGDTARERPDGSETHAIEYYLLKHWIYDWAYDELGN